MLVEVLYHIFICPIMCIVIHYLFHRKVDHSKHHQEMVEEITAKVLNTLSIQKVNDSDKP